MEPLEPPAPDPALAEPAGAPASDGPDAPPGSARAALPSATLAAPQGATPAAPQGATPPSAGAARVGAGVSVVGGLGAIAGFFLPWFVFVAAVSLGCRAPLQIEMYNLSGAGLALGGASGSAPAVLAIFAFLCALIALVIAALALRRATRSTHRRARLLLILALLGLGAVCALGVMAARGQLMPGAAAYSAYLGVAGGIWVTVGGLLLVWIGGATLHAAASRRRVGAPIGEIALAALGMVGLLAVGAAAIVVRPAPLPALTCAAAGPAHAQPMQLSGRALYVASADAVYALDADSGQAIWTCRNPLGGVVTVGALALTADNTLIVASRDGYVYGLRARDATRLWRADVGGRGRYVTQAPPVAPVVAHGAVYGVNGAGQVYALRASDGAPLWAGSTARLPASPLGSLLLADGALLYVAVGSPSVHLAALDDQTGRLLWQAPDASVTMSAYPPRTVAAQVNQGLVFDEEISPQTQGRYLVARGISDGVTRWRYALSQPSAFTIANGMVYLERRAPAGASAAESSAPRVVALRARDGVVAWSTPAPDGAPSQASQGSQELQVTLAADSGGVYLAVAWESGAGGVADTVYGLDAHRGTVRWRYDVAPQASQPTPIGRPHLVSAGASVYLLDPSGSLLILDARAGFSRWRFPSAASPLPWYVTPGDLAVAAPTASDAAPQLVYVVTSRLHMASRLYAIDPADGSVRWRLLTETPTSPYASNYGYVAPAISPPTLAAPE